LQPIEHSHVLPCDHDYHELVVHVHNPRHRHRHRHMLIVYHFPIFFFTSFHFLA
jgi:hypothetical protein